MGTIKKVQNTAHKGLSWVFPHEESDGIVNIRIPGTLIDLEFDHRHNRIIYEVKCFNTGKRAKRFFFLWKYSNTDVIYMSDIEREHRVLQIGTKKHCDFEYNSALLEEKQH